MVTWTTLKRNAFTICWFLMLLHCISVFPIVYGRAKYQISNES